MDAEKFATDVADRVRELIAGAERRAAEIVREAEEEAKRIRARAESEGQERLAEVRRALDDLQGKLSAAGGGDSEVDPGPVRVPEPTPDPVPEPGPVRVPEPSPEPSPEPTPQRIPEPTPPPDEGTPPSPSPAERGAGANGGDAARSTDVGAARLVAMNMALDGASREEIEAALAADYELDDQEKLVDEVLAKATK
jgi:outer membrane biosynthesis protein TonB